MAAKNHECLTLALAEVPRTPPGSIGRPDLVIGGIGCASELNDGQTGRNVALMGFAVIAKEIANDPTLLGDDRSGAWMAVVDAYDALGDKVAKQEASLAWVAFLESAAANAKTPEARAVFDTHRMMAYLAVGRGADAVTALERSERDFPDDYNPPARKANALMELGRLDEAVVAINRALTLVYGPRRLRVRAIEASIYEKRKEIPAARNALESAIKEGLALPEAQRPTKQIATLAKRLAALQVETP